MDSLIFALSAVAPIVLMVVIGYVLKRMGWMDARFAKQANKIVFRILMPVMLFVKIYGMSDFSGFEPMFIGYGVIARHHKDQKQGIKKYVSQINFCHISS
jgi:predicted permease